MREKITFTSGQHQLAGLLESPDTPTRAYALFAHCFTCGKDIAAASRIARALTQQGIAVLRFDFTGLGNSDGDFANTNFSSNVEDLLCAAEFLRSEYDAPSIIIGHSLGGAAVLAMAGRVAECKAVVTLAAPHQADHVIHNFHASVDEIEQKGEAEVTLGLRQFTIKKQFLDDLNANTEDHIGKLNKALLVMHSPVDTTVDIEEAEKIYRAAKHPKSFISLNKADHLISKLADAQYVATSIAAWASQYLDAPEKESLKIEKGKVHIAEVNHKFKQQVTTDDHLWIADEPKSVGGENSGPDPYEHLLSALGTCTAMTIRMYATRKAYPLHDVSVTLSHDRQHIQDLNDCNDCHEQHTNGNKVIDVINREISLKGNLTPEQRQDLMRIADKCPVHKTLHNDIHVSTQEKPLQ